MFGVTDTENLVTLSLLAPPLFELKKAFATKKKNLILLKIISC